MSIRDVGIGTWLLAIGAVHVGATPLFFGDAVRSIGEAGVLFAVEADPDSVALRSSGFWYATAGLAVLGAGGLTRHVERTAGVLPRWLPAALGGLGLWGVLLEPRGGFWLFLPLAELARRRVRGAWPGPNTATTERGIR